jgi:hypothetical protein
VIGEPDLAYKKPEKKGKKTNASKKNNSRPVVKASGGAKN